MPYKDPKQAYEANRRYIDQNREKVNQKKREVYAARKLDPNHHETYKRLRAEYSNRPEVKEARAKRRAVNKEKSRINCRDTNQKYRNLLLDRLGNKCKRCDFSDIRALQFDHIYADGPLEHTTSRNYQYYKKILEMENPESRYQILCANCNWIKRAENNEHLKRVKPLDA